MKVNPAARPRQISFGAAATPQIDAPTRLSVAPRQHPAHPARGALSTAVVILEKPMPQRLACGLARRGTAVVPPARDKHDHHQPLSAKSAVLGQEAAHCDSHHRDVHGAVLKKELKHEDTKSRRGFQTPRIASCLRDFVVQFFTSSLLQSRRLPPLRTDPVDMKLM